MTSASSNGRWAKASASWAGLCMIQSCLSLVEGRIDVELEVPRQCMYDDTRLHILGIGSMLHKANLNNVRKRVHVCFHDVSCPLRQTRTHSRRAFLLQKSRRQQLKTPSSTLLDMMTSQRSRNEQASGAHLCRGASPVAKGHSQVKRAR